MDIALLADAVRAFLAPALAYLMGLGGKAAEEAAKETGKAGVKKVWDKLRPRVEAKEGAKEAAEDLAAALEDPDAQAAFRMQLKKLLAADEELASELARELEEAGVVYHAEQSGSGAIGQGTDQSVAGERGVATHGGVYGSQVFTGDVQGGVLIGPQPGADSGAASRRSRPPRVSKSTSTRNGPSPGATASGKSTRTPSRPASARPIPSAASPPAPAPMGARRWSAMCGSVPGAYGGRRSLHRDSATRTIPTMVAKTLVIPTGWLEPHAEARSTML